MSLLDDDRSLSLDAKARSNSNAPFIMGGYEGENEDEEDGDTLFTSGRRDKGRVRSGELSSDWQKTSGFSLRRKKDKGKEKDSGGVRGKVKTKTPPESPSRKYQETPPLTGSRKGNRTNVAGQSSPNLKTNRKTYSHLLENDDFSSPGEEDDEDNFLLSKGQIAREKRQSAITGDISSATNQTMFAAFDSPDTSTTTQPTFPVQFSPPKEAKFPDFSNPLETDVGDINIDTIVEGLPSPETIHQPIPSLPPPPSHTGQQSSPFVSHSPFQLEATTATVAMTTAEEEDMWTISEELRQKCVHQFQSLLPENGLLSGQKARDFFLQSRLPRDQLSRIWKLSDINRDGQLNLEEFIIAMKLVMMRRNNHEIPSALPDSLKPKPLVSQSSRPKFNIPPPPPTADSSSQPLSPPVTVFSTHFSKTEPSVATSEVQPTSELAPSKTTPTIDHITVGDSIYAVVQKGTDREECQDVVFSNLHSKSDNSLLSTSGDNSLLQLGENVTDPAVSKLINVSGLGEESTGDEIEDDSLNLVSNGSAPVPKPRKKRNTTTKADKSEIQVQRGRAIHGRPPPKPAPYIARSVSPPPDMSSDGYSNKSVSPSRDDITPIVKSDELVQTKTRLRTHTKPLVMEVEGRNGANKGGGSFGKLKEDEAKTHGRSVSWDLSKMLNELGIEIHEDLPTAEPPKPPPRRSTANSDDEHEESKLDKLLPIQRSASTGSLSSIGSASKPRSPSYDNLEPEPLIKRIPTIARRPAPAPPPKPKKPLAPKKPTSVLDPYPTEDVTSGNADGQPLLSAESYLRRNKVELQKSIKILKEETNMFHRMNKELQIKLNELRHERVSLQAELDALTSLT